MKLVCKQNNLSDRSSELRGRWFNSCEEILTCAGIRVLGREEYFNRGFFSPGDNSKWVQYPESGRLFHFKKIDIDVMSREILADGFAKELGILIPDKDFFFVSKKDDTGSQAVKSEIYQLSSVVGTAARDLYRVFRDNGAPYKNKTKIISEKTSAMFPYSYLIGNGDNHGWNMIVSQKDGEVIVYPIDNGKAFHDRWCINFYLTRIFGNVPSYEGAPYKRNLEVSQRHVNEAVQQIKEIDNNTVEKIFHNAKELFDGAVPKDFKGGWALGNRSVVEGVCKRARDVEKVFTPDNIKKMMECRISYPSPVFE